MHRLVERRYAWRGWTDSSGQGLTPRRAFAVGPGSRLYRFDGPPGLRGGRVTVEAVLAGRTGWHVCAETIYEAVYHGLIVPSGLGEALDSAGGDDQPCA